MCYIDIFDCYDFQNFKVSLKVFEVFMIVVVYCKIVLQIEQLLYFGIIEVGGFCLGMVKFFIGFGMLLMDGIGDIIWVLLVVDLIQEIKVGFDIFKSFCLCSWGINFIVCLSCFCQEFDVIGIVNVLEQCLEDVLMFMDVLIIGCVVNGFGEVEVLDLGFIGVCNMSGYYFDGKCQKECLVNDDLVD